MKQLTANRTFKGMTRSIHRRMRSLGLAALGLAIWEPVAGRGQNFPALPESVSAAPRTANRQLPGETPAEAIELRSPVEYFRKLLAMPRSEREAELSKKPPEKRELLLAKIREYEALPEAERESRFQLLQLWSLLAPLMKIQPAERGPLLAALPLAERAVIQDRLEQWDLLPPPVQKEVLESKLAIHYFLKLEQSTPTQRDVFLSGIPEQNRRQLEAKLEQWRALPPDKRQRMYQHFHEFFQLPPKEKERTLEALSDDERVKIEKSLQTFEQLPPAQRQMCIDSFRKFASMSSAERDQFLKNAERWRAMTPSERETWRNMISLLPRPASPPLPGAKAKEPPKGTDNKPKPPLPGAGLGQH